MALILTITNAGRAALRNADASGTRAVRIASVGVSAAALAATAATAALPGEIKRITTVSGAAVAADIIHLTVSDETMATYTVRSFALYLDDGTLFAAYGQADPIIEKSAQALMVLTVDVTLADITAAQITFGDANFLMPPATVDTRGLVELATVEEVAEGTDRQRAVTPYGLAAYGKRFALLSGADFTGPVTARKQITGAANIAAYPVANPTSIAGAEQLIVGEMTQSVAYRLSVGYWLDGTGQWRGVVNAIAASRAAPLDIQPSGGHAVVGGPLSVAGDLTRAGARVWDAGNDGAGSGMDADLLDGQQGSWYADIVARLGYTPLNVTAFTAASILSGLVAVDGSGSGLDADLLDGRQAADFALLSGANFNGPVTVRKQITGAANIAAYPVVNPTSIAGAEQLIVGEATQSVAYRLSVGYWLDGTGQWRGVVNAIAASRAAPLDIQPSGGSAIFGGPVAVAGDLTRAGNRVWDAANDGAGSGLDADLLDGQQGSWYADIVARLGYTPLNVTSFTAASILSGLVAVDGSGSGLDADLLDGLQGAQFVRSDVSSTLASNVAVDFVNGTWGKALRLGGDGYTAAQTRASIVATDGSLHLDPAAGTSLYLGYYAGEAVHFGNGAARIVATMSKAGALSAAAVDAPVMRRSGTNLVGFDNDGAGSGLDADLLDGQDGSWYGNIPARLGYFPANRAGDTFTGAIGIAGTLKFVSSPFPGSYLQLNDGVQGIRLATTGGVIIEAPGGVTTTAGLGVTGALSRGGFGVYDTGNDGAGSGLDADLLDGRDGDFYRRWANLLDVPGAFPPTGHSHGAADLAGAFAGSLAENGYTVLPNGLILQWMTGPMQAGRTSAANYLQWPIAFPTACFQAFVSTQVQQTGDRADNWFQLVGIPDQNGATIQRQASGTADDIVASAPRVFAIGH